MEKIAKTLANFNSGLYNATCGLRTPFSTRIYSILYFINLYYSVQTFIALFLYCYDDSKNNNDNNSNNKNNI